MRRPLRKRTGRSKYRQTLTAREIELWYALIDQLRQKKQPKRVFLPVPRPEPA
jgi:hypothetical protein